MLMCRRERLDQHSPRQDAAALKEQVVELVWHLDDRYSRRSKAIPDAPEDRNGIDHMFQNVIHVHEICFTVRRRRGLYRTDMNVQTLPSCFSASAL